MQTAKLILAGPFFDSQIYAGKLYLWHENSSMLVVDWDKLVAALMEKLPNKLQFAAHCAFRKGSYLYSNEWAYFARDSEMVDLLTKRLEELAEIDLQVTFNELSEYIVSWQDNPFRFPHSDVLFFHNVLFSGSREGLEVKVRGRERDAVTLWDGPVLSMAGKNYIVALAAGSKGFFEYQFERNKQEAGVVHGRTTDRTDFVRWLGGYSIYGSSYQGGYLADFKIKEGDVRGPRAETREKDRILAGQYSSETLFRGLSSVRSDVDRKYSWGVSDKICLASKENVTILRYLPKDDYEIPVTSLGSVQIKESISGDIVSADSALFGYIIEADDGLLVINSQMEQKWFPNEPVNWHVFPNSQDYLNQMHIVYDEHIEVHSFLHDYYINQETKTVGISKP